MKNEKIFEEIYETLKSRRDSPINSYTSKLMKDTDKLAEDKILEKIGEEATEVIIASKNNEHLIEESADLIFHNLVLLAYKGIELEDLLNEFRKRRLDEK
ncbi:MAG: phosphoribosyl-ATP diphosphatase [Methanobrevibacter sp.]|jgi:phosphoribosyl-ATP pyrophosphohydrolase|nr:phosphoribosyl-ATP diphosphatase [Candidatus Methanovirga basalitermitum]